MADGLGDVAERDPELDALLKEQAEFLAMGGKAGAAKAVRVSRLGLLQGSSAVPRVRQEPTRGFDERLPVLNPDVAPPPKLAPQAKKDDPPAALIAPPVMTEIREREPSVGLTLLERRPSRFTRQQQQQQQQPPPQPPQSFPQVVHRSQLGAAEAAQLRSTHAMLRAQPANASIRPHRGVTLGDGAADDIHSRNTATLSGMSADEIRAAQQQLRAQLDPDLVARIQKRSAATNGAASGSSLLPPPPPQPPQPTRRPPPPPPPPQPPPPQPPPPQGRRHRSRRRRSRPRRRRRSNSRQHTQPDHSRDGLHLLTSRVVPILRVLLLYPSGRATDPGRIRPRVPYMNTLRRLRSV